MILRHIFLFWVAAPFLFLHEARCEDILKSAPNPEEARILKKNRLSSDDVGYAVIDLSTKEILSSHQSDRVFVPASVSKVISTLMALEVLGGGFQFETELGYSGAIESGVLKGNLLLRGTGDPFLTAGHLFSFAQAVHALGVTKIDGALIYDDRSLPQMKMLDEKGLVDQAYNPGVSALSSEFNRFLVRGGNLFYSSNQKLSPIPQLPFLQVEKVKERLADGNRFEREESSDKETWKLSSRVKYSRTEELPVRDPSRFTAETLIYFLKLLGIEVQSSKAGEYAHATRIQIHKSQKLTELVEGTLEYSNNVIAELIFMRAIREQEGKTVAIADSGKVLKEWYQKKMPQSKWDEFKFSRGSGLTTENLVSPRLMSEIVLFGAEKKYDDRGFWSLFSISGWKGWIKERLSDSDRAFRVWAKTGTLDYVSSISGYMITRSNRKLAFTIFANEFNKRALLEKGHSGLRGQAPAWGRQAQRAQDELMKLWIDRY